MGLRRVIFNLNIPAENRANAYVLDFIGFLRTIPLRERFAYYPYRRLNPAKVAHWLAHLPAPPPPPAPSLSQDTHTFLQGYFAHRRETVRWRKDANARRITWGDYIRAEDSGRPFTFEAPLGAVDPRSQSDLLAQILPVDRDRLFREAQEYASGGSGILWLAKGGTLTPGYIISAKTPPPPHRTQPSGARAVGKGASCQTAILHALILLEYTPNFHRIPPMLGPPLTTAQLLAGIDPADCTRLHTQAQAMAGPLRDGQPWLQQGGTLRTAWSTREQLGTIAASGGGRGADILTAILHALILREYAECAEDENNP